MVPAQAAEPKVVTVVTGLVHPGGLAFLPDGHGVLSEARLLRTQAERFRDVREGPDGFVYPLTDSADGRVLRLVP